MFAIEIDSMFSGYMRRLTLRLGFGSKTKGDRDF